MISNTGAARVAACMSVAAMGFWSQAARADGDYSSPTDDHVRISLGAVHVSSATGLRADSSAETAGSAINAEGQFGLDNSDFEPKVEAMVRVAARHRLRFDYFTLDRSAGTTLGGTTPVAFRDVTLLPGDPLRTNLSLRTFGIAYEYSVWHGERFELAGTLGVHVTDISALVKVQEPGRHIIQSDDLAGPVPTLGLDATWVASKRFYFDGRGQYLKAHADNIDGSLGIYEFDALYRYRPNVSLGIGYMKIKANLSSTQAFKTGYFDFDTKGPEIFLRAAF